MSLQKNQLPQNSSKKYSSKEDSTYVPTEDKDIIQKRKIVDLMINSSYPNPLPYVMCL